MNPEEQLDKIANMVSKLDDPVIERLAKRDTDPFKILIATMLSARTKDETTLEVCESKKKKVSTPKEFANMSEDKIAKLIYPVGFYRTKAKYVKEIAKKVIEMGKVPDTLEELVKLPGVGRKTANIVLTQAFGKEAIGVDVHVHRISNRIGWVTTKKPEETEQELKRIFPRQKWPLINKYLVSFGRNICKPIKPLCKQCELQKECMYARKYRTK